jgi:hypothetical protein
MTDAGGRIGREDCRMPIGYLITTSLVACGVLGALAPPRRPFIAGVLSFVAGFSPASSTPTPQ